MGKDFFGEIKPGLWRRCYNCRYGVDNQTTDHAYESYCKRYPEWKLIGAGSALDRDLHYCGEHVFDEQTVKKMMDDTTWDS